MAAVPTPLKVTPAADCSGTAPTLTLQMDTVVPGSLMVGGFDLAVALRSITVSYTHLTLPTILLV